MYATRVAALYSSGSIGPDTRDVVQPRANIYTYSLGGDGGGGSSGWMALAKNARRALSYLCSPTANGWVGDYGVV